MREIVLDTETTGLEPREGHRLVELGCIELVNHLPTGRTFHSYINPERDMPEEARRVHGLSADFLKDFPVFAELVDAFLEFIEESPLVIHNARFDMGFINAELVRAGREPLPATRAVDTLTLAQRRFPNAPASLDALCRRFGVDNSSRTQHGALLDSELLAEVYLHLLGGRQTDLALAAPARRAMTQAAQATRQRPARVFEPNAEELAAHAAFVAKLENAVWLM
ncbi:MAG: DNA polymerase III subunit epsilon [Reyranellaceae bacterium]